MNPLRSCSTLAKRSCRSAVHRLLSTTTPPPIGVVMLNMGGPSSLEGPEDGVEPFLKRLFQDGEIIRLGPFQKPLGAYIARRRAPRIWEQYSQIGGSSPIGRWTAEQGRAMEEHVRRAHPDIGPIKAYTAFRYAPPLTDAALTAMAADGVTRAVAFSQYPQFSCTTAGSSLNHLWRESVRLRLEQRFSWSVIDRWHSHPGFLAALARRVALGLARFPAGAARDGVVLVFSAHSLPMLTVNKGDAYVPEVAATVNGVMAILRGAGVALEAGAAGEGSEGGVVKAERNPYVLAWQSKVGFLPWMGPSTADALTGLGAAHTPAVLVVPVAFTSDHVETLFEIDIEYRHLAAKAGIRRFERAPSLNDEPLLGAALGDILAAHVRRGAAAETPQYALNCAAGCTNPTLCRSILSPVAPYARARDTAAAAVAAGDGASGQGGQWPSEAEAARLRARSEPCE